MLILKLVYVGEAVHLNTVATEGRQVSDPPNVGAGEKKFRSSGRAVCPHNSCPASEPPSTHSGPMQKRSHHGYEQRSCSDDSRATLYIESI